MKKITVILINVFLTLLLVFGAYQYLDRQRQTNRNNSIDSFKLACTSLENNIYNYLKSQQSICDSWAYYINNNSLSIEQSIDFLKDAEKEDIMVHIIYPDDNYSGLSSVSLNPDNNTISYAHLNILKNIDINSKDDIKLLSTFVNPINNIESIGLYNKVIFLEEDIEKEALLIRVISLDILKQQMNSLSDDFKESNVVLIDKDGDYLYKNELLKQDNISSFVETINSNLNDSFEYVIDEKEYMMTPVSKSLFDDYILLGFIPSLSLFGDNELVIEIIIIVALLAMMLLLNILYVNHVAKNEKNHVKQIDLVEKEKSGLAKLISKAYAYSNSIIQKCISVRNNINSENILDEQLNEIEKSSNILKESIIDYKDYYDLKNDELELVPSYFSIVDCFNEVLNAYKDLIDKKNIDFNVYVDRFEHEILYADKARVKQIINAIINNALLYCDNDSRVDVELIQELGDATDNRRLVLIVKDNGIGMDQQTIDNLYIPFYRSDDAKNYHLEGKGIELCVVKQLCEMMDGSIECNSTYHEGSEFKIELLLPFGQDDIEKMTIPSKKTLFVCKDQKLAITVQETLYSIGVICELANTDDDALEMIEDEYEDKENYDFVIIDDSIDIDDRNRLVENIHNKINDNLLILFTADKDINDDKYLKKPLFRSIFYKKLSKLFDLKYHDNLDDVDFDGMNMLVLKGNDIDFDKINESLLDKGINVVISDNKEDIMGLLLDDHKDYYSMLLIDADIKKIDIEDLIASIRKLPGFVCNIPIILLSDKNVDYMGGDACIVKPLDIDKLLLAIKDVKRNSFNHKYIN